MYKEIQRLAEEALALQNKDNMDTALREISKIAYWESMKTFFEDKRVEQLTEKLKQYEQEAEQKKASAESTPAKKGGQK